MRICCETFFSWLGRVEIVHADMREWQPNMLADILVSELLGSFGDNELSPECLDGAQRFLKENGISIPSSYTSYLSPITAHKVWTEASSHDTLKHFETPFVVKLFRYQEIAASQPVFTFRHPNFEDPIDNDRYTTLEFQNHRQNGVGTYHYFKNF
jgi:protein arginine N-methyltransferase 5